MNDVSDLYGRLLQLTDLLGEDLQRFLQAHDLTVARAHVLWLLHAHGPLAQHQLAQHLHVTPRNVTGLVDALSASGLAERSPHPTDRRSTLVALTDRGQGLTRDMDAGRGRVADALFGSWAPEEREQFDALLTRCTDRLRLELDA